jgi:hypothetical protein
MILADPAAHSHIGVALFTDTPGLPAFGARVVRRGYRPRMVFESTLHLRHEAPVWPSRDLSARVFNAR